MPVLPLSRRLLAMTVASGLAVGGLVVAGSASAAGEGGGLGLPTAACNTFTDAKGDGVPYAAAADPVPDPMPNDPDLDITGVVLGSNTKAVTAYIRVDQLADSPQLGDGHTWDVDFTARGKAVVFETSRATVPFDTVLGATGFFIPPDNVSVGGSVDSTIALTASYDTTLSMVILSADRVALEKALGGPLAAADFSALAATSFIRQGPDWESSDQADAPAGTVFKGDSNACFGGATAAPVGSATPAPSGSATPTATPTAAPSGSVLLDQPRKKCLQFPDAAGDAATNPVSGQATDADDDLDLTGVVYRTSPDALQAYVTETALGTGPSSFGGSFYDTHSFSTGFTVGGKAIVLTAGASGPATATVGGAASTALHATAAFDTKHSNIVFSVPLADLATVTAQPVKGAAVTALTASSLASSSSGAPGGTGDSAAPTTTVQKTYVVGDNTCFLPPAGVLTIDADSGVYSDVTTIYGNLVDVDGAAVEGAKVTLTLTGMPAKTATTDSDGDATFTFPVTVKAGTKTVGVRFAGNADVGAAKASAPYKVALESTVLKAVGSKGAVTATLTDNDRTPIAKRVVVFTVGSKVTKVATNAKGQAVLKGLARGAVVKVSFAAVSGYYSAAKTVSAKAL